MMSIVKANKPSNELVNGEAVNLYDSYLSPSISVLAVGSSKREDKIFQQLSSAEDHSSRFAIEKVESSTQAVDFLHKHTPDCCLVYLNASLDEGIDFLKNIRRLDAGESLPIIIVTNKENEMVAVELIHNGAQDYLVKSDITAKRLRRSIVNSMYASHFQEKLKNLAHYDSLTGLLNRNLFTEHLQDALNQSDRYNKSCTLLYIDIDNFKTINDSYGHEVGDELLAKIGQRLSENCRASDSAARLGGDEFAVFPKHSCDSLNRHCFLS